MRYRVIQGVDCFEVGVQQLLDFMGWKSYVRDDGWIPACGLGSCISAVVPDDYVVVRTACEFGQIGRPCVTGVFSNFSDATDSAGLLTMVEYDCMLSRSDEFDMYFCYEVWHVMDDGDLWQAWDYDAGRCRVDVPVQLDSCHTVEYEDFSTYHIFESLWRAFVPSLGDFLSFIQRVEVVLDFFGADEYETEYVVLDCGLLPDSLFQIHDEPKRFSLVHADELRYVDDPLGRLRARRRHAADDVMEALRQLRAAGDPCGGDGVGAIR